jgi:acyl-coenzyme A thioesterase PaaI-like protein
MAEEHAEIANKLIDEVVVEENEQNNFDNSFDEKETNPLDDIHNKKDDLLTHNRVQTNICGDIIELEKGYSKISFLATELMISDDLGLIHSGFIFSAADYCAAVAVNEQNTVIIASRLKFLAPVKLNDLIIFKAKVKFEDSRKREIKVTGAINDIKVFDGIFQAVVLEKHIFKLKLDHI